MGIIIHIQPFLAFDGASAAFIVENIIVAAVATGASILYRALKPPESTQLPTYPPNEVTRGGYLPLVIGRRVVGCNVGWVGGRGTKTNTSGGGGKGGGGGDQTTTTSYIERACHQLCHGPVRKLHRIWKGDKVIWSSVLDSTVVADGSSFHCPGGEGAFNIYFGRTDQPIDSYLAGKTNVQSAYPGMCFIQWTKVQQGGSPNWNPYKYEIETFPDDIADAAGIDLTFLGVETHADESTPAETTDGTRSVLVVAAHGSFPAIYKDVPTRQVIVWFFGKQSIPAGDYTMSYERGAYRRTPGQGWQVYSNTFAIEVVDTSGTSYSTAPHLNTTQYSTQDDAEAGNAGATISFTWPGGPMGMRVSDIATGTANSNIQNGSPNPTYSLELTAGGPIYNAAIAVNGGAAGSGDSGANAVAAIYLICCAPFPWGCGMDPAIFDQTAAAAAASQTASEGLVVNVLADSGKQASDAVASLMSDAGILMPIVAGQIKLYPIRVETTIPDLTADLLPNDTLEENQQCYGFNSSRFTFQIPDVLNNFAVSDVGMDNDALASQNNRPTTQSIVLENITNRFTGTRVAYRKMLEIAAEGHKIPGFSALREARNPLFHVGRSFLINGKKYRLNSWKPDTQGISAELEAVLDKYGDTTITFDDDDTSDNLNNPAGASPEPDTFILPLIIPRDEWKSAKTPLFGAARVRANDSITGASVWICPTSDGAYINVGRQDTASAGGTISTDFDTTPGLLVAGPEIIPFNDDIIDTPDLTGDSDSYNSGILVLVCEQEIMLLESLTANLSGTYTPNNLTRGAFGTIVAAHTGGTPCAIVLRASLAALSSPLLAMYQGSSVFIKTQPTDGSTMVDLSLVTAAELVIPTNLLATLSITHPVGNETINAGTLYPIHWSETKMSGSVKTEYSDDGGSSWTTISSSISDVGSDVWDTTGLTVGSNYVVRVSSVDNPSVFAVSSFPFNISAHIDAIPGAPSSLMATAGVTSVALAWGAASEASTYNVKRSLVMGGPYDLIWYGLTGLNFTDTGLTTGTPYYYVVSAVNVLGEGPDSAEATATPT